MRENIFKGSGVIALASWAATMAFDYFFGGNEFASRDPGYDFIIRFALMWSGFFVFGLFCSELKKDND